MRLLLDSTVPNSGFPRDLEPQVSEPGILCFDSEEHSILVILVSELCETKREGFWKDCFSTVLRRVF